MLISSIILGVIASNVSSCPTDVAAPCDAALRKQVDDIQSKILNSEKKYAKRGALAVFTYVGGTIGDGRLTAYGWCDIRRRCRAISLDFVSKPIIKNFVVTNVRYVVIRRKVREIRLSQINMILNNVFKEIVGEKHKSYDDFLRERVFYNCDDRGRYLTELVKTTSYPRPLSIENSCAIDDNVVTAARIGLDIDKRF